jgi:hypothetical protein
MGVSNPAETIVGILAVIDEVKAKMDGTKLATYPWSPTSPEDADKLAGLATEALLRCEDITEAVVVVAVAAVTVAHKKVP